MPPRKGTIDSRPGLRQHIPSRVLHRPLEHALHPNRAQLIGHLQAMVNHLRYSPNRGGLLSSSELSRAHMDIQTIANMVEGLKEP